MLLAITLLVVATATVAEPMLVRRNVRDFGAVGDGKHDDTAAFIVAMTRGKATKYVPNGTWNASQYGPQTVFPSIVLVPEGEYLLSSTIPLTFNSQLVGMNADKRPTLKFVGQKYRAMDAGEDLGGWFQFPCQDNFFHQIRNIVVDISACTNCTALHWEVSQATNINNVHFELGNTATIGILMEQGSGGYMGCMSFRGGKRAILMGNQQYTVRNVTIRDADIGIELWWDWTMAFIDIHIENVSTAILANPGIVSLSLIDVEIKKAQVGLNISGNTSQVTLDNFVVDRTVAKSVVLYDGTVIASNDTRFWIRARKPDGLIHTEAARFPMRPRSLVRGRAAGAQSEYYFAMMRPEFNSSGNAITATLTNGTDVTNALQAAVFRASLLKVPLFLPYGVYYVSRTIYFPAGTRVYGEAWTRLLATGEFFKDPLKPRPVLLVGALNEVGVAQFADIVLSTNGSAPGAVMMEWNMQPLRAGDCGAWDVHFRVGGFHGSYQGPAACPTNTTLALSPQCYGAHTLINITNSGSVYVENMWGWTADHDIDTHDGINIYNARGLLSTSQVGPVWLYGTGMEHNYLYQYNFVGARNHFISIIQTESPYYQPEFTLPYGTVMATDPPFRQNEKYSYALSIQNASFFVLHGAGMYSFFNRWDTSKCGTVGHPCQEILARIEGVPAYPSDGSCEVHMLNTHGSALVVEYNGKKLRQEDALNGFCQTQSFW